MPVRVHVCTHTCTHTSIPLDFKNLDIVSIFATEFITKTLYFFVLRNVAEILLCIIYKSFYLIYFLLYLFWIYLGKLRCIVSSFYLS